MCIELVIAIESLSTESTFWMTLETALIDSPGVIVPKLFMLSEFLLCEKLVLVGKDLLIPGAEIAHDLVMDIPNMPMQVRPAIAGYVTACIWTIVAQQQ